MAPNTSKAKIPKKSIEEELSSFFSETHLIGLNTSSISPSGRVSLERLAFIPRPRKEGALQTAKLATPRRDPRCSSKKPVLKSPTIIDLLEIDQDPLGRLKRGEEVTFSGKQDTASWKGKALNLSQGWAVNINFKDVELGKFPLFFQHLPGLKDGLLSLDGWPQWFNKLERVLGVASGNLEIGVLEGRLIVEISLHVEGATLCAPVVQRDSVQLKLSDLLLGTVDLKGSFKQQTLQIQRLSISGGDASGVFKGELFMGKTGAISKISAKINALKKITGELHLLDDFVAENKLGGILKLMCTKGKTGYPLQLQGSKDGIVASCRSGKITAPKGVHGMWGKKETNLKTPTPKTPNSSIKAGNLLKGAFGPAPK